MQYNYVFTSLLFVAFLFASISASQFLNASSQPSSKYLTNTQTSFDFDSLIMDHFSDRYASDLLLKHTGGSYSNIVDAINPTTVKCQGLALCLKGDVVKVVNGKSFYVSINNKIYKIDLALIGVPVTNPQLMMASATFTRNTCLGGTVLIDQDDGQRNSDSIIGTVYCSPAKSLNAMLLETGYVLLDKSQCVTSEFAKTDWARARGC
jgi:endonuclease YncB( thermonuclease family)